MPKPLSDTGERNIIRKKLIALRKRDGLSQRELALNMQLVGIDMDKNAITLIETGKRYVSDIEIKAFAQVFDVSYTYLLDDE